MIHFNPQMQALNEIEAVVSAHVMRIKAIKLSKEQLKKYSKDVQIHYRYVSEYWWNMEFSDFHTATQFYLELNQKCNALEAMIASVKDETLCAHSNMTHVECLNLALSE